jgi:hypothetical protein
LVGSFDQLIKRISVENREVKKVFCQVCGEFNTLTQIRITVDDQKMLVGGERGELKLISFINGKVIKDFDEVHDTLILGIRITEDQKFYLTSSTDRRLQQWNNEDKTLFKDHRKLTDEDHKI